MKMPSLIILIVGIGLMGAPALQAQQAPETQDQAGDIEPLPEESTADEEVSLDIDVSEEDAKRFAQAYEQVNAIRDEYAEKTQGLEDEDAVAEARQEAQSLKLSAVEDTGLNLDEYNAIRSASRADTDIHEKIMSEVAAIRRD
ncbi:hypothetical protein J2T60_000319 [Natronospira proteinivora]|uniref:DUF4168 domain-containing protein n=1 Tax=Natronospira proteinivora TaxID=1807133 RepID=A0ABT1G4X9_9GAMM|nr:DUF4168 domain-containing protein [Natronospira proteinivora]MCP1726354.1 hypothetical protein [Natronospira proteinivora]